MPHQHVDAARASEFNNMTQNVINVGIQGNDGTGDSIRESFNKVNENFTELYAVFGLGGTLTLASLSDGTTYTADQIIAATSDGTKLSARSLTSSNNTVVITHSAGAIDIKTTAAKLVADTDPTLIASLNAAFNPIGNLLDPSTSVVNTFNLLYANQQTLIGNLPVTVDYGVRHYVVATPSNITAGTKYVTASAGAYSVAAALKTRNEPIIAPTTDSDYDSTLTGNYLKTETVQRQHVVYRGGDTMTGELTLNDHPVPLAGAGTPKNSSDLQAATKYYVDNNTTFSNVNLYVSTSGDDAQTFTPVGRAGRAPQYAYKTVVAAALQAENLINLSQLEPGPYRQTITYTQNGIQTKSTVSTVVTSGGNFGVTAYTDAQYLLQANREFIQQETVAYINSKYVQSFQPTGYSTIIKDIVDGIAYDLLLGSTFQTVTKISSLFNLTTTNQNIISTQLAQITDAINYVRTQINTYSYSTALVNSYIDQVVNALVYDLCFGTNFQSILAGLNFKQYGTGLQTEEIIFALDQLKTRLQNLSVGGGNTVGSLTTANTSIVNNITIIKNIIIGNVVPALSLPAISTTTSAQTSAQQLLLNNIPFIQAEIIAYLTSNYANLQYSKETCARDVKYIVWSLVYDLYYGGNSQSVYAGLQYWGTTYSNTLQIQAVEKTATINAINYLKTLVQNVLTNTALGTNSTTLYQTTVVQYINRTLSGITAGDALSTGVLNNIAAIQTIVSSTTQIQAAASVAVVNPSILFLSVSGQQYVARQAILSANSTIPFHNYTTGTDLTNANFPVINDASVNAVLDSLFSLMNTILVYGVTNSTFARPAPTLAVSPIGANAGYPQGARAILINTNFIAEDAYLYYKGLYSTEPLCGAANFKFAIKAVAEAVAYDINYSTSAATTNSASIYAANQLVTYANGNSAEQTKYYDVVRLRVGTIVTNVASNNNIASTVGLVGGATYTTTQNFTITGGGSSSSGINTLFTAMNSVLSNGTVPATVLPSTTNYVGAQFYNAFSLITSTDTTVTTEVVNYVTNKYVGGFSYDQSTCYRDVGLIIDAMVIDLVTGGTFQSINAGKSYYKNASAQVIAIGTQYSETVDGLKFAQQVAIQVLNQYTALRYQSLKTQSNYDGTKNAVASIPTFTTNYNTMLGIITSGYGSAPEPTFGSGLYTINFSNGGRGYVDQGTPGNVHIIPGKMVIGNTSGATGIIVAYVQGTTLSYDSLIVKLTQPGFFTGTETLDFGETVNNLNITIFVESGIYYEDFPIKIPANVTIRGDDFRRVLIRPKNRTSQSPWRTTFFYRDAVIDNLFLPKLGGINFPYLNLGGIDYAPASGISISAGSGNVTATLASGNALPTWIGLIFTLVTTDVTNVASKAVVTNISGNVLSLTILQGFPFSAANVFPNIIASGSWHLYSTINYGRHYLTDPSNIYSTPLNNKDIDMFLANDAVRIKLISGQGHGGFMMVLDPAGQIKTKSPYAQECGSFSSSLNQTRFAGGQFIDGFSGRVFGNITNIAAGASTINGTSLTIEGYANTGLDVRSPQVPCSFYVKGNRYQVNDVTDYSQSITKATTTFVSGGVSTTSTFVVASATGIVAGQLVSGTGIPAFTYVSPNYVSGSTTVVLTTSLIAQAAGTYTFSVPRVVVTLDNSTPFYPLTEFGGSFTGFQSLLGSVIDAINYDMVFGSNYQSAKAGLTLLLPQYSYQGLALALVQQAISYAGTLINNTGIDATGKSRVLASITTINNIVSNGISGVPVIAWTAPTGATTGQTRAQVILQANKAFIQQEIVAHIAYNFNLSDYSTYSAVKSARDIGYIIDAMTYDILYANSSLNGNSQTYDTAKTFYGTNGTSLLGTNGPICLSAYTRLKTILALILVNTPVTITIGNNLIQDITNTAATAAETTRTDALCDLLTDYVTDGAFAGGVNRNTPTYSGQSSNLVTNFTTISNNRSTTITSVTTFVTAGGNLGIIFETAGNRSMLANDYTQVNDLGYGIVATNNGLTEQVSTFTYYNHTAYWALNGGQIRSIGGSNSNGDYGLRSTGYDPTQVPNVVTIANDQVQTARVYKQGAFITAMTPTATAPALSVYLTNWSYLPFNNSEIEIDHTLAGGGITRYSVSTIQHTGIQINGKDVLQLNVTSTSSNAGGGSSSGLQYALYDGQVVTLRVLQNQKIYNVATVRPTRPSTSFQYASNLSAVYRIISYGLNEATGETLVATSEGATAIVIGGSTSSAVITVTIISGTLVTGQLVIGTGLNGTFNVYAISSVSAGATRTSTGGSIGTSTFTVDVATGIYAGQIVTGTGIPTNTFVGASYSSGSLTVPIVNIFGSSVLLTSAASDQYIFGAVFAVTLSSPPASVPAGILTYTFKNQTQTTSVVQTDSQFNYFIITSDSFSVKNADPTPYTSGYASGNVVSYNSGTFTLVVNGVTGTITQGMTVGGVGIAGQTVAGVSGSGTFTVVLSAAASTSNPPVPNTTIWFTTQTQGSKIGDNKIAVVAIANSSTISQINTGTLVTTWSGRVHRIISYVQSTTPTTAQYVDGGTSGSASPLVLRVSTIAGTITAGQLIYNSAGYTTGQTVVGNPVYSSLTGYTSITLSSTANAGTPSGTIYFGRTSNAYIIIDPNSNYNLAANGVVPSALTFAGAKFAVNDTTYQYVTFNIPNTQTYGTGATISNTTPLLPPVDSFLTISGQTTAGYNGTYQVLGTLSRSTITVASTQGLGVGMIISSTTPNAIIPVNCIVQTVSSDSISFTVSPSVWIPSGGNITGSFATVVASVIVSYPGNGEYTTAPTITFSEGGATIQATATATVSGGIITGITLISAGAGYTGTPTVSASYGSATFTVSLSNFTPFVSTVVTQSPLTQVTIGYPAPIANTTGIVTGLQFSGNLINLGSVVGGSLIPGNVITFTTAPLGVALGNLISGTQYYILTVAGANITISTSQWGTAFVPIASGSASGVSPYMTFSATNFSFNGAVGSTFTTSNIGSPSGSGSGTYTVTYTIPSTAVTSSYVNITGNTNGLYNGTFYTATTGTVTSLVVRYPSNPGTSGVVSGVVLSFETTTVNSSTGVSKIGIATSFSTSAPTSLRAGYAASSLGQIIVNISTCRATGHDFLLIGTGSYNTSNYPNTIFGPPSIAAVPSQQVLEENVGRVFYVSTDESGIFRVGRFFSVDQGTGTVTFSASIALSNLSGLGFKTGVVITQFSTEATFQDNASYIVPVQSAIRSYIDYRLGITQSNAPVPSNLLLGSGFLPLNGVLAMSSNINMGSNSIINLKTPVNIGDATSKIYVDQNNFISNQRDVSFNILGTATAVASSGNLVTLSNVTGLSAGNSITFTLPSGGAVIGNLTANIVYYILSVDLVTSKITISTTPNGSVFNPGTASGTMYFTAYTASQGHTMVYDTTSGTVTNAEQTTNLLTLVPSAGSTVASLQVGDTIYLGGTPIPNSGLTVGTYYILSVAANKITVSATFGGATFTVLQTSTGSMSWSSSRWRNISVPRNTPKLATTGGSGTAGTASLTFSTQSTIPFPVGSTIIVSGVLPVAYNGTFVVTVATTSSVSYTSAATGSLTQYGIIYGNQINFSYNGGDGSNNSLTTIINADSIVNSQISSLAAVLQSKLLLNVPGASYTTTVEGTATVISNGTTLSVAPSGTAAQIQAANGLASFNSAVFNQSNGWVDLAAAAIDGAGSYTRGIRLPKIEFIPAGTVLGNQTTGYGTGGSSPSTVSYADVVTYGNGLTNDKFTSAGIMTVASVGPSGFNGVTNAGGANTYSVTNFSTTNGNNTIPISDNVGAIDVKALKLNATQVLTTTTTGTLSTEHYSPGQWKYLTATGVTTGGTTTPGAKITLGAGGYIDTTSSTLFVTKIVAGDTTHASDSNGLASFQGQFTLQSGSTLVATYSADLAEYYEGDKQYEVGDVVVFGGDKEVTTTTEMNDTRLAGVVSSTDKAAYVMYDDCPGLKNLIALAGRVPCKVVGRVKKGDMLTTSATPGYAVKANNPTLGSIIGKALQDKDYGEAGIIEVAVGRN